MKAIAVARECRRQEESCLYTSSTLFVWLRTARIVNVVFVVVPILLGGAAGLAVLEGTTWGALLALVAGFFPAVREALKLDPHIGHIKDVAGEFKNLQDAFRNAALVTAPSDAEKADALFGELMARMDAARLQGVTPPEWCFRSARKKIQSGHYDFTVDEGVFGYEAPQAGKTA